MFKSTSFTCVHIWALENSSFVSHLCPMSPTSTKTLCTKKMWKGADATSNFGQVERPPTARGITSQVYVLQFSMFTLLNIYLWVPQLHQWTAPGPPGKKNTITAALLPQLPRRLSLTHYLWNNNAKICLMVTITRLLFPLTLIGIVSWNNIWGKMLQLYWLGNTELPTEHGAYSWAWMTDLMLVSLHKETENDMLDFQSLEQRKNIFKWKLLGLQISKGQMNVIHSNYYYYFLIYRMPQI